MGKLEHYFPDLGEETLSKLLKFKSLLTEINKSVNLISRKDIEHFEEHHLLPCLAFKRVIEFLPGSEILDVGSGGGLPGLPLAILFPEVQFTLVDSMQKKVNCILQLIEGLELKNVDAYQARAETVSHRYDFVTGRAVAALPEFMSWVKGRFKPQSKNSLKNGILYLKGGDLEPELKAKGIVPKHVFLLKDIYPEESFLESKYIVHFSAKDVNKITDIN